MPSDVGKSMERVSQAFDAMKRCKFLWLLLMIMSIASISSAQPRSAQRAKPTTNRPRVAAEAASQTIFQKCAAVEPDASYVIPPNDQFGGRTEASGSGAYAYKPAGDCRYWVVDFMMNRTSNTWVNESGALVREYVLFSGNAFDLPSSSSAYILRTAFRSTS